LSSRLPIVVIGSGPAGIAAARALLAAGNEVTMLDAGATMPDAARDIRARMVRQVPNEWDRSELERLNLQGLKDRGQVPLKTTFGSDYPYHFNPLVQEHGVTLLGSRARGGLSNVWGACILPLNERDLLGWPLTVSDFEPHYQAVFRWLPHSQVQDELAEHYPLHSSYYRKLGLSRQARSLQADLRAAGAALASAGIRYGRSRLALSNCFYCGQCLHGCPYELIYSSNETLDDLLHHPGFTYHGNTVIEALEEHAQEVILRTSRDDALGRIVAERVYVAAGVLNTALLILPLLDQREMVIRDSAYNLVPFLRYERMPRVEIESLYTLAQLFMEVDVPEESSRNAHLQWYSYNDFYRQEMRRTLGRLYRLLPELVPRQVIERMWTIQTFLHSDDSPSIRLRFDQSYQRAELTAIENARTAKVLRAVYRKLRALSHLFGGRPLPLMGRMGAPGGSFHAGASLPMARQPRGLESDTAGRPGGLQRIHVVDASVLSNIAASTITLSVMANAHRIAAAHREYS